MSFIEYIFVQLNTDCYQMQSNFLVSLCLTRQKRFEDLLNLTKLQQNIEYDDAILKEQNMNNCNMIAIFAKGYLYETQKFNILQIFAIGCGNTTISFLYIADFLFRMNTIIFRLTYFGKFMPQCELRETHTYIFDCSVSIYCQLVSIV